MIQAHFEFAGDHLIVEVDGNNVVFMTLGHGGTFLSPIDGLKLDYQGVIKEFPDLSEEKNWKEIAIQRFKGYISKFKTEIEKIEYIIEDLKKHGYTALYIQRRGHRPIKIK